MRKKIFELGLLIKNIPPLVLTAFVMSVFSMNLLAGKSISLPFDFLALDCGILVSWLAFLIMDLLTAHFGPRAATMLSIVTIGINLVASLIFAAAGSISGVWSAAEGAAAAEINSALNATFGGTWYIILGSTAAFIVAAVTNNFTSFAVGKLFRKNPDSMGAYLVRSYVSTALGQFADNFIFALIVSHTFFGWSLLQCVTCALAGMIAELVCEIVFSVFGYKIRRAWQRSSVGAEYIRYVENSKGKT